MINKIYSKFFIRILMVIFWILIIIFYVYSPIVTNLLPSKKTLNVYCWVDVIDENSIREFEKATGIDVNLSLYEHNFELFSKLEITQGRDYDLIFVTDFVIPLLIKANLLQPIDSSKLDFWNDLEPALFNKEFDPGNKYSAPYQWDIYVVGYNKQLYPNGVPAKDWSLIFDKNIMPKHIGMLEESNEAFMVGAQYLYKNTNNITEEKLEKIKDLLIAQKPNVESYVDLRASDLLSSGAAPVAVGQSAYITRPMKFNKNISFFVPSEGSFAVFDSFVIPKASDKQELVYKFLNFANCQSSVKKVTERYCYLPNRKDLLVEGHYELGNYQQIQDLLKTVSVFSTNIPIKKLNECWMEVKSY